MANQKQLTILRQGVIVWNKWRYKNDYAKIDLSKANLTEANLSEADLSEADLRQASLRKANLRGAILQRANLRDAYLRETNLIGADLTEAVLNELDLESSYLNGANLSKASLKGAHLSSLNLSGTLLVKANLYEAYLRKTNLVGANLRQADLRGANLSGANLDVAIIAEADLVGTDLSKAHLVACIFSKARVGSTKFGNLDLGRTMGLENVVHSGPSSLSTDTLALSKGKLPEVFLRGCGLSDWEIESEKLYNPDLSNEEKSTLLYKIYDLLAGQALQISPLFISYSRSDSAFVDKIESYLNRNGIRFWRDVHDMKAGRMEKQIDHAIRNNPTVLLILSKHSLKSDWVEHEVKEARKLEKEMGRDVLCPVALDDSWKDNPWPKRVMEQVMEYNILDFSAWQDDSKFGSTFNKLINGLELFYRG